MQHPIDYRTQDHVAEVKRLAGGRGVDLVLDALGGPRVGAEHLGARAGGPARLLRLGERDLGRVAQPSEGGGGARDDEALERARSHVTEHHRLGVNVGRLWGETKTIRATLDALLLLWREGKVRSRIDRMFPLAEGPAAHRRMHERKNVGKILFDCA